MMDLALLQSLVCRPALVKDAADVVELTRTIWDGEDYVPDAWEAWLADPQGLLAVAEYGKHVVGLVKLSHLSSKEWWLEGLRVDPQFEGRKFASRLYDYILGYWSRNCGGTVRLVTASFRLSVQHLCQRTGFNKIAEFSFFEAPSLTEPAVSFTPLLPEETQAALEWVNSSPSIQFSHGLIDLGWHYALPSLDFLLDAAKQGLAWWWREREGVLLVNEDAEDEEPSLSISLLATSTESIAECLVDFRRLAAARGASRARWTAPLDPRIEPSIRLAGFTRQWRDAIYLYEKEGPNLIASA